jgi:hypothetical protein
LNLILERSSETTRGARSWRGFVRTFVGVFFGAVAIVYAVIILVDPYDIGFFPSILGSGVADLNQQTNSVSRGRDSRFNAAVFGNSHGQLLNPELLSQATGLRFIQLTSPGSGPREHMTLMRYFIRNRSHVSAIVLAADASWCTHDPALPTLYPFPLWLYSGSRLDYLANILSTRSFSSVRRRIQLAQGKIPAVDPAGFWDYEAGRAWTFRPAAPADAAASPAATVPTQVDASFPAIVQFDRLLAALPDDTSLVIVMPPQFYSELPKLGTRDAAELALCKAELARRVVRRAHSGFLDFLVDSPLSRDPENFMDADHYRYGVAHLIEGRIAAILTSDRSANGETQ